jgi:hypothetical protein
MHREVHPEAQPFSHRGCEWVLRLDTIERAIANDVQTNDDPLEIEA